MSELDRIVDALDWPLLPPTDNAVDDRVRLLAEQYELAGKRILEPGCFDGYLTVSLTQLGAKIVAFDARPMNVVRAITRGLLRGVHLDVRIGDVRTITRDYSGSDFDLLFHCGLFYHLSDPVTHLQDLAKHFACIALDTHTARPGIPLETLHGFEGHWEPEYGWDDAFSGIGERSFWLTEEALEWLIIECGLEVAARMDRNRRAKNGPRSFYLLRRLSSRSRSIFC